MAVSSFSKRILVGLAGMVLLAGIGVYFALKSAGVIPRAVYETVPPEFPQFTRPALLVLNKANGYVHRDAIPAADKMLRGLADQQGWDVFVTDNAASHNAVDLARFDAVVWNNTSGDILTQAQRADFKAWLLAGGAWLGLHAAGGDPSYQWQWYVESLLGAQFIGHTMFEQFRTADVLVVDRQLAITGHLPAIWRVPKEEWYAFGSNPRDRGIEVLLSVDESSYMDETEGRGALFPFHMAGEHPVVWRHTVGKGRVFYSSIGHQAATYDNPHYQELIRKALLWVSADALPSATPSVGQGG